MTTQKQLKITANSALIEAFKSSCEAKRVSMASVLKCFLEDYTSGKTRTLSSLDYSTRRKRRKAIGCICIQKQLQSIAESEAQYRDRIPENLQSSATFERADELVNTLEEAINLLTID